MATQSKKLPRTRLLPQEVGYKSTLKAPDPRNNSTPFWTPGGRPLYAKQEGSRWYVETFGQCLIAGQSFTSYQALERAVIQYLRSVDKFGDRAIYPGSKRQLSNGTSNS